MTRFYLDTSSGGHHVYAMLCQDGSGPLYVKFGYSSNVTQRLTNLRTSCPVPAKWFCVADATTEGRQKALEKQLHLHFKPRRVTGEWFKFDSRSEDDKRAFNDGCRLCFRICEMSDVYWDKISVQSIDAYNKQRKASALAAMRKSGGAGLHARRKKERREYARYRQ